MWSRTGFHMQVTRSRFWTVIRNINSRTKMTAYSSVLEAATSLEAIKTAGYQFNEIWIILKYNFNRINLWQSLEGRWIGKISSLKLIVRYCSPGRKLLPGWELPVLRRNPLCHFPILPTGRCKNRWNWKVPKSPTGVEFPRWPIWPLCADRKGLRLRPARRGARASGKIAWCTRRAASSRRVGYRRAAEPIGTLSKWPLGPFGSVRKRPPM